MCCRSRKPRCRETSIARTLLHIRYGGPTNSAVDPGTLSQCSIITLKVPIQLKIRGRVKRSGRKRFADYFAL